MLMVSLLFIYPIYDRKALIGSLQQFFSQSFVLNDYTSNFFQILFKYLLLLIIIIVSTLCQLEKNVLNIVFHYFSISLVVSLGYKNYYENILFLVEIFEFIKTNEFILNQGKSLLKAFIKQRANNELDS